MRWYWHVGIISLLIIQGGLMMLSWHRHEATQSELITKQQELAQTIGFLYGQAEMENLIGRLGHHQEHVLASCVGLADADRHAKESTLNMSEIDTLPGMIELRRSCR